LRDCWKAVMTILDPESEVREAARRIQQALTRLGYAHESQDGHLWEVSFRGLYLDASKSYGLIEVDTNCLPRRVSIARLTHKDVLHHLTAVVGKPVRLLNTSGLTYCVVLKPRPSVRLPRKVELDMSQRPEGEYVVGFGLSRDGPVWRPLESLGHLLVAGSTGSGKSAFLRSLIYQLLRQPLPIDLYLTDLEGLTFAPFAHVPQLKLPIAESVEAAKEITAHLLAEMERRAALYAATGRFPENLAEYHSALRRQGDSHRHGDKETRGQGESSPSTSSPLHLITLSQIVAVFDEFSPLMEEAGKGSQLYRDIAHLAMRARKYGISLVFAGQDFKADLMNTRITNQLRTRVQFRCATAHQSQVVLGRAGAEKISVPGRALVSFDGKVMEVQTFWVDKSKILDLVQVEQAEALNPVHRELTLYARDTLGGKFTITALAEAFKGEVSQRQIEKLSKEWERRGWLIAGPTRAHGKTLSEELLQLLG